MPPLIPDEDKNFGGCLVLDCTKWWRQVKTIYSLQRRRSSRVPPHAWQAEERVRGRLSCKAKLTQTLFHLLLLPVIIMLSPSQLWYSIQDARRGETCANFTIATMNNEVFNCQNLRTTGILSSVSCRLWYKCSHVKNKLQWGYISLNWYLVKLKLY